MSECTAIVLRKDWMKERQKFFFKGHPYYKWFDLANREYRRKKLWINEQKVTSPYALFFGWVHRLLPNPQDDAWTLKIAESAKKRARTPEGRAHIQRIVKLSAEKTSGVTNERMKQLMFERFNGPNRAYWYSIYGKSSIKRWKRWRDEGHIVLDDARQVLDLIYGKSCYICGRDTHELYKRSLELHHLWYDTNSARGPKEHNQRIMEAFKHPERFVRLCRVCHAFITIIERNTELDGAIDRIIDVLKRAKEKRDVILAFANSLNDLEFQPPNYLRRAKL